MKMLTSMSVHMASSMRRHTRARVDSCGRAGRAIG